MKKSNKLILLLFTLVLALSLSVPAFAKEAPANAGTFTTKSKVTSQYVKIHKPVHKAFYYKGETIPCKVTFQDVWKDYYTQPAIVLFDANDKDIDALDCGKVLDHGTEVVCQGKFPTTKLRNGKYSIMAIGFAADKKGNYIKDGSIFETSNVDITLRTLAAPTSFTAKAARKKVSIAFKKATGAKKCEIYRSTKKTSGFKKIATITATKYTDKKVRKGKRYFYKVRSLRTGNGTAKSSYTKTVRTGKVK